MVSFCVFVSAWKTVTSSFEYTVGEFMLMLGSINILKALRLFQIILPDVI